MDSLSSIERLFQMPNSSNFDLVDKYKFILLWVSLGLVGVYVVKIIYKNRKFVNRINKLPGPKPFPFLGNLREMGFCNSSVTAKINTGTVFLDLRHGVCSLFQNESIFRIWFLNKPVVFLFGAETVEPVLTSNVSINKSKFYNLIEPWLGNGLLLRVGEKWRTRRKMLTPTFHFRILQDFLPLMNLHSDNLVKKIRSMSNEDSIDIVPLLTNCTLDIISETAMGFRLNCQDNPDTAYAKAVHDATFSVSYRGARPWLWNKIIFGLTKQGKRFAECVNTINSLTSKVIKEKKDLIRKSSKETVAMNGNGHSLNDNDPMLQAKKRRAFLDLLLEKHQEDPNFTEKDITDEVNTFMFGGHDTTATSLTWILYLLGHHPDVQEKVYNEVVQVLGEGEVDITMDQTRELKYMDMVLKECQRLYPAVPGFAREAEEDIKIGNLTIPEGASIYIFTYVLHRDPKAYPNPELFDPERFSPENSNGRHPYAYIPFSAGPRNCIGQKYAMMEMKVVLSHVIRNLKVKSLDPRDKVILAPEVVLRPLGDVRLKFQERC